MLGGGGGIGGVCKTATAARIAMRSCHVVGERRTRRLETGAENQRVYAGSFALSSAVGPWKAAPPSTGIHAEQPKRSTRSVSTHVSMVNVSTRQRHRPCVTTPETVSGLPRSITIHSAASLV